MQPPVVYSQCVYVCVCVWVCVCVCVCVCVSSYIATHYHMITCIRTHTHLSTCNWRKYDKENATGRELIKTNKHRENAGRWL